MTSENLPSFKKFEQTVAQKLHSKKVTQVFGPSPSSSFIGRFGYPNVYVGPMVIYDESLFANKDLLSNNRKWYGMGMEDVAGLTTSLARGEKTSSIKNLTSKLVLDIQDNVLSTKALDLEIKLEKPLSPSLSFSNFEHPTAAAARMETFTLADNPVIPRKIDSIMSENVTVREVLPELVSSFDNNYIQKILSVGVLGEKENRKLVPTRWSITASDKMIADLYITELKDHAELSEVLVYENSYVDNHYRVLLLPGPWEFEQFEAWSLNEKETVEHEYEPFEGRSDYAETEGGGYYAGRLAVSEFLSKKLKRQARVVVFREIGKEYTMALGVWQVRESIRHAFDSKPLVFENKLDAFNYLKSKLRINFSNYLNKSNVLQQNKLTNWF